MIVSEKIKITLITGIVSVAIALVGGYFSAQHIVKQHSFVLAGLIDVYGEKEGLSTGKGTREVVRHVDFSKEFSENPSVILSINSFDINDGSTIELLNRKIPGAQDNDFPSPGSRLRIFTRNVNTKGFDCVIQTWSKTEVYGVTVNWYALPSKFQNN